MPDIVVRLAEGEEAEFGELLLGACARQMLSRYVADEDGHACEVPSNLARRIESAVVDEIRSQAREVVPEIVERVLATGVVRTDAFGYGRGETRSVADVIAEQVKDGLVHSSGRRGPSVLEQMIRDEVDRAFKEELHQTIEAAKAPVLAAVREKAAGVFEEALRAALPKGRA